MLRKFVALSRSTHGMLDLATTGFAALLWLGHLPAWSVLIVALATAAAGYTALYALNDLVGVTIDREKFANPGINLGYSVESSGPRHPLAQGVLSMQGAIAWFALWYIVALVGAWWLNPLLIAIVLTAPLLETLYCLLLRVTYWRVLIGGLVKSLGPIAAVLTVVPRPSLYWLCLMIAWLTAWEIGGQNIPADWNDADEDRRVGAKTIPVLFGARIAGTWVFASLIVAVCLSLLLPLMSPLALGLPYLVLSFSAGLFLLLVPGFRLFSSGDGRYAAKLFDRASFYPVVQLAIIAIFVALDWH